MTSWLLVALICFAPGECSTYAIATFKTEAACLKAAKQRYVPKPSARNPYNFCIWFGDQA